MSEPLKRKQHSGLASLDVEEKNLGDIDELYGEMEALFLKEDVASAVEHLLKSFECKDLNEYPEGGNSFGKNESPNCPTCGSNHLASFQFVRARVREVFADVVKKERGE